MKKHILRNKDTAFALGFAGMFMGVVTAVALILSEVSPAAIF